LAEVLMMTGELQARYTLSYLRVDLTYSKINSYLILPWIELSIKFGHKRTDAHRFEWQQLNG